jgi:inositol phosphorylceramide mannosyltransferase catalytic subunit
LFSSIPKRIIHIWGGGEHDLPLLYKAAAANVKLLNPDFEYLFFDDSRIEDVINGQFPEYRGMINSFRFPIQRYDFFRYLAVYHFGGFYLDCDVLLACSLSDLIDFGCVFPFEELNLNIFLRQEFGMDWGIGNYAFGAAEKHPFILEIIKNCVKAQKNPMWAQQMMRSLPGMFHRRYYVLNTTGPGLVARTLAEYPEAGNQVKILFPKNVCDSRNWYQFGTVGVHLMKGTWRKERGFLRNRLYAAWLSWIENKLFKESRKLGEKRSLEFRKKIKTKILH